jgi:hypothetical protein
LTQSRTGARVDPHPAKIRKSHASAREAGQNTIKHSVARGREGKYKLWRYDAQVHALGTYKSVFHDLWGLMWGRTNLIYTILWCCQTNEPKHQYSFGEFCYEVTKERHSVRAASRFSLNVLRFERDLCELNRL